MLPAALLATLTACHRGGADWRDTQVNAPTDEAQPAYIKPPQVFGATRLADGTVSLSGKSEGGVRVRLSSPDGAAYGATAGQNGAWSISLPASGSVRLFGLAEEIGDRLVQGEGYIAVLPPPGRVAVLLRAGGGALSLEGASKTPEIDAVDFDAGGAAVVSGAARHGQPLKLTVDQTPAAESRADARDRFAIGLSAMLRRGDHTVTVEQGQGQASVQVTVSPPPAISGLPYRGAREAGDWRVDWMTPGGGVQTTLVIDRQEAAK